jgi:hypothetical protein
MKATEPTLSRHLLVEARKFALYPQRVRKAQTTGTLLDRVLKMFVASREWVVEQDPGIQDLSAEVRERLFDEHYSKVLLETVQGMAVRTDAVPTLQTREPICRGANLYLREATRSYILGLWDAAVALSRAALEEALEDRVRKLLGPISGLNELIKAADDKRLMHRDAVAAAERLQRLGNAVLHARQGTEEEALASVCDIRVVLRHLYGSASRDW